MSERTRIVRLEWARLEGRRPRRLGRNARLGEHEATVRVPVCRLTDSDGATGVGLARLSTDQAYELIGTAVAAGFDADNGTTPGCIAVDFPLWDLAGVRAGVPVYRLGPLGSSFAEPPSLACYDTSLYFDDLLAGVADDDHARGAAVVAAEAAWGYEQGHRAFKVKIGRGGRWMSHEAGLARDVAVVAAVRDAVGPECPLYVDANNGYTLTTTRDFLGATAALGVGWMEEPFAEDPVLLRELRRWLVEAGLDVEIADGESATAPEAARLAADGLLDVVQCDILGTSFTGWLQLGPTLDSLGVVGAPHHFGLHLGNYVTGHLLGFSSGIRNVEWDEAATPGIAAPGYRMADGRVQLSERPGFGVDLDDEVFARARDANGFDVWVGGSGG